MRTAPSAIRLEASSFCQLRCPSCPTTTRAIHPAVGSGFLRIDDFRKLIAAAPGVKRIELSNYGEVFLNPELPAILQHAHENKVAISLANGVNLNHVREEALEAVVKYQVTMMNCSIDGASAQSYRKYRVRGDFDTVIGNIEKINAYKRQYRSELPRLQWQFIVFGHNEDEMPAARAMAERLGMEFRTKLTWDPDFSPIRNHDLVRLHTGSHAINRQEYEQEHGRKYANEICHQLWDEPQINWNGKVLGCCRNFWGDFGGNAFEDGVLESVNHEKMIYARAMLTGRAEPRADIPCSTCDMYTAMRDSSDFLGRN